MRTYGRLNGTWVEVDTDANGYNDPVYLTTLCQVLKLSPNESPFYANYGLPAQETIMTQVYPDYYIALTQSQFSDYFASLTISKVATNDPTYNINILTNSGSRIVTTVAT